MTTTSPQTILQKAKTVVLKVGSVLVADLEKDCVRQDWLRSLANDVQTLMKQGKRVIIVSSGGIALGRKTIGVSKSIAPGLIPLDQKQAASAVGQFHVFHGYFKAFDELNVSVAQVLLTLSETENRRMHLNARETLNILMDRQVVPIINENDTISTEEIRFGDNDRLSVRVAQMAGADLVILFSTIDGLYTADPGSDPEAKHMPTVSEITEKHVNMAGDALPGLSTGGMKSKLQAAISASNSGIPLIITDGREAHCLQNLVSNPDKRSTLFMAQANASSARKRWIQGHVSPKGKLIIDNGAIAALKTGKSLLPIGVKNIEGSFQRGDPVIITSESGHRLGVGLSAYDSHEATKIAGKQSADITEVLGYTGRTELVHRNDMVLD